MCMNKKYFDCGFYAALEYVEQLITWTSFNTQQVVELIHFMRENYHELKDKEIYFDIDSNKFSLRDKK